MKRTAALVVCIFALLAFFASSARAAAPLNFYIRGGIVTPSDFSFDPIFGLAGANIDFNLGALSISPECDLLIYNFTFNPVFILPGALVNFNLANLYVGAGAVLPLVLGSGYTLEGDILFKANAGLKFGGLKIQAFLITPFENFFTYTWVGATLGAGF
jgi:hypothetical protein